MKVNTILLLLFLIAGCKKEYKNKDLYQLKVGETVELYYSTNSCCYYCVVNEDKIKHLELLDNKLIDSGSGDCDGCDRVFAFIFKAKSSGVDTVYLKRITASNACDSTIAGLKGYVVEVAQ